MTNGPPVLEYSASLVWKKESASLSMTLGATSFALTEGFWIRQILKEMPNPATDPLPMRRLPLTTTGTLISVGRIWEKSGSFLVSVWPRVSDLYQLA